MKFWSVIWIWGLAIALIAVPLVRQAGAFGHLGSLGAEFGKLGASPKLKKAAPLTPCGAVGLDFTDPCGTTNKMVLMR